MSPKTKRRIALLSLALVAFLGFSLPTAAEAAVQGNREMPGGADQAS